MQHLIGRRINRRASVVCIGIDVGDRRRCRYSPSHNNIIHIYTARNKLRLYFTGVHEYVFCLLYYLRFILNIR